MAWKVNAMRLLSDRFGSLACTTKPFKITSDPFLTGHATNSSLENVGIFPLYSINESAFGSLVRHDLVYNPFVWEPLMKYKHPFSSVASSVGIQNPVTDSIGLVRKENRKIIFYNKLMLWGKIRNGNNEVTWRENTWHLDEVSLHKKLRKATSLFALTKLFILNINEMHFSFTFTSNFWILIDQHALQNNRLTKSKLSSHVSNAIVKYIIWPVRMF